MGVTHAQRAFNADDQGKQQGSGTIMRKMLVAPADSEVTVEGLEGLEQWADDILKEHCDADDQGEGQMDGWAFIA